MVTRLNIGLSIAVGCYSEGYTDDVSHVPTLFVCLITLVAVCDSPATADFRFLWYVAVIQVGQTITGRSSSRNKFSSGRSDLETKNRRWGCTAEHTTLAPRDEGGRCNHNQTIIENEFRRLNIKTSFSHRLWGTGTDKCADSMQIFSE